MHYLSVKLCDVNWYRSQLSSSCISNLIVAQREKEQSTIQPQALRQNRTATETSAQRSHRGHTPGNMPSVLGYTWAISAAPASHIRLNARLSDRRFLLADLAVESAEPIRRAPSTPIRLFLRDKWVRLDQRNAWHYNCSCVQNGV